MSQRERTGSRDLTYSRWHRMENIKRFLPLRIAACLKVIDIDWCEACQHCSEPLALIETQAGDRPPKPARISANLAQRAQIEAYSVSYVVEGDDIAWFRVHRLWPVELTERRLSPDEYAGFLWSLRERHICEVAA